MEIEKYKKRIEAYLDKKMDKQKRSLFETELEYNKDLQKAFLKYGLQGKPISMEEEKVRSIAKNIRQELGGLTEPHLGWFDKLQFFIYDWSFFKTIGFIIITLLLALVIGVNIVLDPIEENLSKYKMLAYCPGIAGSENDTNSTMDIFYQSAEIYCYEPRVGDIEKFNKLLTTCSGFCVAHYYQAHCLLDNFKYKEAVPFFEGCLQNSSYLSKQFQFYNQYHENMIRLNLIIAKIGAGQNIAGINSELKALQQDLDGQIEISSNVDQLYRDLNNPIQYILF